MLRKQSYRDSFEGTNLESVLLEHQIGRLFVVGAQTDFCIRSTLRGALVRGYDVTLVSDAHTTEDQPTLEAPPPEMVIAHTNLYWASQTAPGRRAGAIETTDVDFRAEIKPDRLLNQSKKSGDENEKKRHRKILHYPKPK